MKHIESTLQVSCVRYFRYQYPQYKKLLFSIPNGGKRGVVTASIMKQEGALAGVDFPVRAILQQDRVPVRVLWSPSQEG